MVWGIIVKFICVVALALGGSAIASMAQAQQTDTSAPSAAPAQPTRASAPTPTAQIAPADDPNEIICHQGEPVTGSRIPGARICRTRKQWDDRQRDAAQMVSDGQRSSAGSNPIKGH
jgi:hypothetical protein